MEISGIFGMRQGLDLPMTEEQKSRMEDILGKYDPENVSREDMESLRQELLEAGIPRSKESMQMMREAGFGPPAKDGDGPQGTQGQLETKKGELWDIYQQLQNGEISEADFMQHIRGQVATGSLIDYIS